MGPEAGVDGEAEQTKRIRVKFDFVFESLEGLSVENRSGNSYELKVGHRGVFQNSEKVPLDVGGGVSWGWRCAVSKNMTLADDSETAEPSLHTAPLFKASFLSLVVTEYPAGAQHTPREIVAIRIALHDLAKARYKRLKVKVVRGLDKRGGYLSDSDVPVLRLACVTRFPEGTARGAKPPQPPVPANSGSPAPPLQRKHVSFSPSPRPIEPNADGVASILRRSRTPVQERPPESQSHVLNSPLTFRGLLVDATTSVTCEYTPPPSVPSEPLPALTPPSVSVGCAMSLSHRGSTMNGSVAAPPPRPRVLSADELRRHNAGTKLESKQDPGTQVLRFKQREGHKAPPVRRGQCTGIKQPPGALSLLRSSDRRLMGSSGGTSSTSSASTAGTTTRSSSALPARQPSAPPRTPPPAVEVLGGRRRDETDTSATHTTYAEEGVVGSVFSGSLKAPVSPSIVSFGNSNCVGLPSHGSPDSCKSISGLDDQSYAYSSPRRQSTRSPTTHSSDYTSCVSPVNSSLSPLVFAWVPSAKYGKGTLTLDEGSADQKPAVPAAPKNRSEPGGNAAKSFVDCGVGCDVENTVPPLRQVHISARDSRLLPFAPARTMVSTSYAAVCGSPQRFAATRVKIANEQRQQCCCHLHCPRCAARAMTPPPPQQQRGRSEVVTLRGGDSRQRRRDWSGSRGSRGSSTRPPRRTASNASRNSTSSRRSTGSDRLIFRSRQGQLLHQRAILPRWENDLIAI